MSKKKKKSNIVTLATFAIANGDEVTRVKIRGHKRSQKKRIEIERLAQGLNDEQLAPATVAE